MRKILAPHKEQEGYVYIRVARCPHCKPKGFAPAVDFHVNATRQDGPKDAFPRAHARYYDHYPEERIISSRRVEEAVETADYLKRCAEEGLGADYFQGEWKVQGGADGWAVHEGSTLREAYHRYKARA